MYLQYTYSLERAGRIFDCSVRFAKSSAKQTGETVRQEWFLHFIFLSPLKVKWSLLYVAARVTED